MNIEVGVIAKPPEIGSGWQDSPWYRVPCSANAEQFGTNWVVELGNELTRDRRDGVYWDFMYCEVKAVGENPARWTVEAWLSDAGFPPCWTILRSWQPTAASNYAEEF